MRLPDGWHSVTPRIVVDDVVGLVDFMRRAFGATGELRADRPAVLRIGDSVIMISSAGPRDAIAAFLYLYVEDADALHGRAVLAGATSLEAPSDTPYGDRRGMVQDRWGNVWQIATPKEDAVATTTSSGSDPASFAVTPIGFVRSSLAERKQAPRQGSEGAPDAWVDIESPVADGLDRLRVGDEIVLITWLHRAKRDVLQVHPRGDPDVPLTGVFATRSLDRPNPLGLHRVTVLAIDGPSLKVGPLEAIDGTPIVDIKCVLAQTADS